MVLEGTPGPDHLSDEAKGRHVKMHGFLLFVLAPSIATALTWAVRRFLANAAEVHDDHMTILSKHDLGWVYAAWYILFLTRWYHNINSNGARAGARVGRPDQHVYKVASTTKGEGDEKKEKKEQKPVYVLLENDGPIGRFNRAQRATFHMDEVGTFVVTAALLAGFVLPKLVFGLSLIYMYGRVRFANQYRDSLEGRTSAMIFFVLPEHVLVALVGITAIRAVALG